MLRISAEKGVCQIFFSDIKGSQLCVCVINEQLVETPELHSCANNADEWIIKHVMLTGDAQ